MEALKLAIEKASAEDLRRICRVLAERLEAMEAALKFYAEPRSIEPHLTEGKEKKFGRPGIGMAFYAGARKTLAQTEAALREVLK